MARFPKPSYRVTAQAMVVPQAGASGDRIRQGSGLAPSLYHCIKMTYNVAWWVRRVVGGFSGVLDRLPEQVEIASTRSFHACPKDQTHKVDPSSQRGWCEKAREVVGWAEVACISEILQLYFWVATIAHLV